MADLNGRVAHDVGEEGGEGIGEVLHRATPPASNDADGRQGICGECVFDGNGDFFKVHKKIFKCRGGPRTHFGKI